MSRRISIYENPAKVVGDILKSDIDKHVAAKVAEERERCARIVDAMIARNSGHYVCAFLEAAAEEIRKETP